MFEVNPENQKMIDKLFKKNELYNFNNKLFKFGLGKNKYTDILMLNNAYSYEGSLANTEGTIHFPVSIKPLTINMLPMYSLHDNVFVCLDVEGFESEVLQGMTEFLQTIKKDKKHIDLFIEIKDEATLKGITLYLKKIFPKMKVKKMTTEDYLFSN